MKHRRASKCTAEPVYVSIQLIDETIHLTGQDNGVGIAEGQRIGCDSHGLKIMRERVEAFGSPVNVGLALGKGT